MLMKPTLMSIGIVFIKSMKINFSKIETGYLLNSPSSCRMRYVNVLYIYIYKYINVSHIFVVYYYCCMNVI